MRREGAEQPPPHAVDSHLEAGIQSSICKTAESAVGCGDASALTETVLSPDATHRGLKMGFFDLPNGGYIEIVAPTGPESVLRPALDKSGPGMNLMAFQCHDLPATVAAMKANPRDKSDCHFRKTAT